MTIDEASKHYQIPIDILQEYERWGFSSTLEAWQYDDRDIERLSMILTLRDIGFDNVEIETYMRLLLEGESTKAVRLNMLNKKRTTALEEIHFKEAQLNRLDYLRHKIQTSGKKKVD